MLKKLNEKAAKFTTSKFGRVVTVGTGIAMACAARADTDPMAGFVTSITTSATNLVTTLASVAGAALPLFALFYGVRATMRMFKIVK